MVIMELNGLFILACTYGSLESSSLAAWAPLCQDQKTVGEESSPESEVVKISDVFSVQQSCEDRTLRCFH